MNFKINITRNKIIKFCLSFFQILLIFGLAFCSYGIGILAQQSTYSKSNIRKPDIFPGFQNMGYYKFFPQLNLTLYYPTSLNQFAFYNWTYFTNNSIPINITINFNPNLLSNHTKIYIDASNVTENVVTQLHFYGSCYANSSRFGTGKVDVLVRLTYNYFEIFPSVNWVFEGWC